MELAVELAVGVCGAGCPWHELARFREAGRDATAHGCAGPDHQEHVRHGNCMALGLQRQFEVHVEPDLEKAECNTTEGLRRGGWLHSGRGGAGRTCMLMCFPNSAIFSGTSLDRSRESCSRATAEHMAPQPGARELWIYVERQPVLDTAAAARRTTFSLTVPATAFTASSTCRGARPAQ